jgi:ribosomal protein S18 acetylase RimI-like enzyme
MYLGTRPCAGAFVQAHRQEIRNIVCEIAFIMFSRSNFAYQITQLQPQDVPATVRLHRQVFLDYFLTHMGQEFLELFYHDLIPRPGYSFLAKHNGQVIGFVAGTIELDQFYRRFYQQHFLSLARIVIVRTITDPYIRRTIWQRRFHLRNAGKALLRWRPVQQSEFAQPTAVAAPIPNRTAHLLSIGVANDFRGQGIAEALSDHFCQAVAEDGVDKVLLSVLAGNSRAIHFYTKTGWRLVEKGHSSLEFSRSLNIKREA